MTRKVGRARELRRTQTRAERRAWGLLRGRRLLGVKFRRQYPIGNCVVDFYCVHHRLAIELDGEAHAQPIQIRKDRTKDAYLKRLGVRVLRISNGMVIKDPAAFLETIRRAFPSPVPTKSGHPLPGGEGSRFREATGEG